MSRTSRLLDLMQLLRRRRRPVAAAALASELGVSLRTVYRDIATLQAQGARIDGEAGIGYLLRPGFTLPPLMFSENEIEAIGLGVRWVAESADAELSAAAEDVLAKIADVVPDGLRRRLHASPLFIGPVRTEDSEKRIMKTLRTAIDRERKVVIRYVDRRGKATSRTVWPFGLTFFEEARLLMAWCEKRGAIRHFRPDRIREATMTESAYPNGREKLLALWSKQMGFDVGG